jgi:glycerol-3-phosphate dehydrogenase
MDREKLNQSYIYDVAIIGGGIVGSGLFREQALNGKSSVIIDQSDFNSQTSAGSQHS